MQIKLFAASTFAFATLAAATATPARRTGQCATGTLQCCQNAAPPDDPLVSKLLGLLNIVVGDITALVGVTCNPITVIGAGSTSCSAEPVCCTNNGFNGVVALGCTPISL